MTITIPDIRPCVSTWRDEPAHLVTDGTRCGLSYLGATYWAATDTTLTITPDDPGNRTVRDATYPETLAARAYHRARRTLHFGGPDALISTLRGCEATLAEIITIASEDMTDE